MRCLESESRVLRTTTGWDGHGPMLSMTRSPEVDPGWLRRTLLSMEATWIEPLRSCSSELRWPPVCLSSPKKSSGRV